MRRNMGNKVVGKEGNLMRQKTNYFVLISGGMEESKE